jgi:hypothetical protein
MADHADLARNTEDIFKSYVRLFYNEKTSGAKRLWSATWWFLDWIPGSLFPMDRPLRVSEGMNLASIGMLLAKTRGKSKICSQLAQSGKMRSRIRIEARKYAAKTPNKGATLPRGRYGKARASLPSNTSAPWVPANGTLALGRKVRLPQRLGCRNRIRNRKRRIPPVE